MRSSLIDRKKIMLVMPVVSANIRQNNNPNFGSIDYTISRRAGKMIQSLVETPDIKTRGILTTLYTFIKSKTFESRMGGAKSCYIDNVSVSLCTSLHQIEGIDLPIPIQDTLLLNCKVKKSDQGTSFFRVQKDSDAIYSVRAEEYVQKDKQAAERLLRHLPWWKRILL